MPLFSWSCLRRYSFQICTTRYQPIRPSIVAMATISKERSNSGLAIAKPVLNAISSDNSIEVITEEDLYRYKRHRWVYNESLRLSERYLKFDLRQLLDVAVAALKREGARYCTRVLKCKEGYNNKAYLLTMDNGMEIFAKLPNPCAGPSFFTTASEVATREFIHMALDIPNPRILSWCADPNNPVGAEYILEEKAPGMPLGSLWHDWHAWPMATKHSIVEQVVEMERSLTHIQFAKSGCIYFREDIPGSDALVTNPPLSPSILERFTLGPLVNSQMWRGEKGRMDYNRGPYHEPLEFIEALSKNEKKYVETYGRPRMNYARSLSDPELPEEMLTLLGHYCRLAPAMVPPQSMANTHSPTLWHSDLHLDNVFVDLKSKQITGIIDWQSAAVLSRFYQSGVPTMFKHQGPLSDGLTTFAQRPENYIGLEQDEKEKIDNLIRSEHLHKYYLATTHDNNPIHWATLQLRDDLRVQPVHIVQDVWDEGDMFFLQRALIRIVEAWEDLCPGAGPCPVSFSEHEIALYAHEQENRGYVSEILTMFRDRWGLPPNGSIESARFNEIKAELMQMKDAFVGAADNEEDRILAEKLWPYQDTCHGLGQEDTGCDGLETR